MTKPSLGQLTMVTTVWGDWHIKMLLEINVPSMLASQNLPALVQQTKVTYEIYTQDEDYNKINGAAVIQEMRRYLNVNVLLLTGVDLTNPIAAHHQVWMWGIEKAKKTGQLILLMPPDVVWSNGSFRTIGNRLKDGHRNILMTFMRAEETGFEESISALRKPDSLDLELSGEELVSLSIRSLHPLMAAYLHDSEHFPIHPEMIFWPVENEGLLLRVLAREMFLFDPATLEVNQMALPSKPLAPGETCFIDNSDDLFAVSLTPINADIKWYRQPQKADPIEIAGWWLTYDSPANDFTVSHKIRWHFAPVTEEKWKAVERVSDIFVRKIAIIREAIRIWSAAQQLGCKTTAQLIALSMQTRAAFHAARKLKGQIIFLPTDEAFDRQTTTETDALYDTDDNTTLINTIRSHIVSGYDPERDGEDPITERMLSNHNPELSFASGQSHVLDRQDGKLRIGGIAIMGAPIRVGAHVAYVIDGLLGEDQNGASNN